VVTNLPEGASETVIDNETFIYYNNAYYQPININGQSCYEVVDMREQPQQ
jgi:hypothetical protein